MNNLLQNYLFCFSHNVKSRFGYDSQSTQHNTAALWSLWTDHDNKVYGADMRPTWGRQDPGWPHVGLMDPAIWVEWIALYIESVFSYTGSLRQ